MADLFDTNIIIDLLEGVPEARAAIEGSADRAISVVSRIEVLSGAKTDLADRRARALLAVFQEIGVTSEIAERTVAIRRQQRLKLPDAVVLATAQTSGRSLLTRDRKAFSREPNAVFPYSV